MNRKSGLIICCLLTILTNSISCAKPEITTETTIEQPLTSALTTQTTPTTVTPRDVWGLWGPVKWSEEYNATPGAYLDFVKKEELIVDGKPAIIYFLIVDGLPENNVYHLWVKSLSNQTPTELIAEAKLDNSGYVMKGDSRFQLGVQAPAKGEAMEFALMTADKSTGALGKVIPYPIESKQGPYRFWVELRSRKGEIFIIFGEGFEPNEEVTFTSNSEGELAKGTIKTDGKGRFQTIVLPSVVGKESGIATYSVLGRYGEIKISYDWGTEATKTVSLSTTPTPALISPTTQTTLPPSTQTRPLDPIDALKKGIHFADWNPYDEPQYGLYMSPGTDQSLQNLASTGANWISIVVTRTQETIASTTISHDTPRTPTDAQLRRVINLAHNLGMRVMLWPGLVLSSDPDHWWGQIGTVFTTEAQWQEWFASYRDSINHYAAFAQEEGVDMLCIGAEAGGTTHREADWRRVIKEVRERYKGPITYSSLSSSLGTNTRFPHGEENRISWWDAVDYIGVSAYYSLTNKNDPTLEELKAAWTDKGYIALLENLSNKYNRPIIFSEIGYPSSDGANRHPATQSENDPIDLQEQADCYRAVLEVMWGKSWFAGIFWWQWFAETYTGGTKDKGATPWGKPAEDVLREFYLGGK